MKEKLEQTQLKETIGHYIYGIAHHRGMDTKTAIDGIYRATMNYALPNKYKCLNCEDGEITREKK